MLLTCRDLLHGRPELQLVPGTDGGGGPVVVPGRAVLGSFQAVPKGVVERHSEQRPVKALPVLNLRPIHHNDELLSRLCITGHFAQRLVFSMAAVWVPAAAHCSSDAYRGPACKGALC